MFLHYSCLLDCSGQPFEEPACWNAPRNLSSDAWRCHSRAPISKAESEITSRPPPDDAQTEPPSPRPALRSPPDHRLMMVRAADTETTSRPPDDAQTEPPAPRPSQRYPPETPRNTHVFEIYPDEQPWSRSDVLFAKEITLYIYYTCMSLFWGWVRVLHLAIMYVILFS